MSQKEGKVHRIGDTDRGYGDRCRIYRRISLVAEPVVLAAQKRVRRLGENGGSERREGRWALCRAN